MACDNFTMARMRRPGKSSQWIPLAIALAVLPAGAAAAGRVSVTAGHADFAGLQVEGLEAAWAPSTGANGTVRLRAARIRGIAETGPLSSFALDCATLRITGDELACEGGRLAGSLGSLGVQDTRFTARRSPDGRLDIAFDTFAVAGGRGRVDVKLAGARWRADARLAGIDLAKAAVIAAPWAALPEGFTVSGTATGEFRAAGAGDALRFRGRRPELRRAGLLGRGRRAGRRKARGFVPRGSECERAGPARDPRRADADRRPGL